MSPLKKHGLTVGRREFLAGLGGAGLGVGLGKISHWLPLASPEVGADWRPGDQRLVSSTCLLCPSHCGIRGRVVDDALVHIEGNPLHPVSRGGLCPRGAAGLQVLYHPDRLAGPVERNGESFASLTWKAGLELVAAKLAALRDAGRSDAVAWLGGEVSGSLDAVVERFLRAYGSPHRIREGYDDGSAEVMELIHGIRRRPSFDVERADLGLSFRSGRLSGKPGGACRRRRGRGRARRTTRRSGSRSTPACPARRSGRTTGSR
jgi:hypothetical protein